MRKLLDIGQPLVAVMMLVVGAWLGLVWAPPEVMMGDVYRIMFVHVPSAWMALIGFTVCFVASIAYLWRSNIKADAVAEASAEVGLFFATLLLITGSIWGRRTWGVWWTWDPRLTTAAIMWLAFSGYLALRRFVESPERRATWAAVTAIIIFVDIPIVYFSVRWWNSLHQLQSSPATVDPRMVVVLRWNAFAFLATFLWFVRLRYGLARARQSIELAGPPVFASGDAA